MNKNLLIASLLTIPFFGNSQIFHEDFDGNGPGFNAWTILDLDGLTHDGTLSEFDQRGWIRKDRGGPFPNYGGPDSNFAAFSSSYFREEGAANDWLISPSISLPNSATYIIWDAKAQDKFYRDGYNLMLSPNGGDKVEDFTVTLFSLDEENSNWTRRTVNLESYAGKNVRIAFVNNSTNKFVLLVDNISVRTIPTEVPNCVTQVSPIDNAADLSFLHSIDLSWKVPETGEVTDSYDLFLGTTPNPTTLHSNVIDTNVTVKNLLASTKYYWKVLGKNLAGSATSCSEFSFTVGDNPLLPYCGPLVYSQTVEPITSVEFGGIKNTSTNNFEAIPHESFVNKVAEVNRGGTFPIKLQGDTNGSLWTNSYVVFIDWNQNGDFLDDGEAYFDTNKTLVAITNSTGEDGKEAVGYIKVPENAKLGKTRMRIKKNYYFDTIQPNPCFSDGSNNEGKDTGNGQAEDYTVNVAENLSVLDVENKNVKSYPNPVKDVYNIVSQSIIKSVKIYDLSGNEVLVKNINDNNSLIDFSKFNAGVYIVTTLLENGTSSTAKVIKK